MGRSSTPASLKILSTVAFDVPVPSATMRLVSPAWYRSITSARSRAVTRVRRRPGGGRKRCIGRAASSLGSLLSTGFSFKARRATNKHGVEPLTWKVGRCDLPERG